MGAGTIVTLVLACGVVWGTFTLLGGLICYSTLMVDWVLLPLSVPFRLVLRLWQRPFPYRDEISLGSQFLVGLIFFFYFIFQVEKQQARLNLNGQDIFGYTVLIAVIVTIYIFWRAARYRRHFSRILFYHRFVKPISDWITFQAYALLWLHHIPILYPVIDALDEIASRINHRRWQTFFRCLLFLSLFTLPVQLLPDSFYKWLGDAAKSFPVVASLVGFIEHSSLLAENQQNFWSQQPVVIVGAIYLYLFDWVATVVILYFVVSILSRLEPRNLFKSVADALAYFIGDREGFMFAGYFWRSDADAYAPTVRSSDDADPPFSCEDFALALHKETGRIDEFLPATWQGVNNRVSLVFAEEPASEGGKAEAYCVHYRRFGESAFVVAVDAHGSRFDGSNTRSQSDFLQICESIGSLVNIRHSLKYGGTPSVGGIIFG
jgi:hypothetical protein